MADNAVVIGDVKTGRDCSIWFSTVLRGDVNSIRIGNGVNIQDGSVLHTLYEKSTIEIGDHVSVGHTVTIHEDFIRGRVTLIGCPKLDEGDYAEKLTAILRENDIQSVTVARMEVPCCGGIENAVKRALQQSGKFIPWRVAVISTDGRILSD